MLYREVWKIKKLRQDLMEINSRCMVDEGLCYNIYTYRHGGALAPPLYKIMQSGQTLFVGDSVNCSSYVKGLQDFKETISNVSAIWNGGKGGSDANSYRT